MLKILAALSLVLCAAVVQAADWGDCASELDYLKRRSSDAADKARDAESKRSEFESKRDELQRCVQNPQVYDLLRDRCQSARSSLEWARSSYSSAVSDLGSALDDVDRKVKSVSRSCGAQFGEVDAPADPIPAGVKNQGLCRVYRGYKAKLPADRLLSACKERMSEAECRVCLQ